MSTTTLSPAEVAMAAAVAKQAEATASQAVADAVKAESEANPTDTDLAASVIVKQEEATKDQVDADALLAYAIEVEGQTSTEVPVVAEVSASPAVVEQPATVIEVAVAPVVEPAPTDIPVVKTKAKVVTTTTKAVTPAVVVAPVKAPASGTVVNTANNVSSSFTSLVADVKSSGSVVLRTLVSQLEQYVAAMKPGIPVDQHMGGRNQIALWRSIQGVIERSGEEFQQAYTLLLAYFEAYKDDVFHEHYVFRFADSVTLSAEELATFQKMINLLKLTCSPVGREQSLRQVDLGRTMANNISEQGRQKILSFYGK